MEPLDLRGRSLASRVVVGVLFVPLVVCLLWIGGYALFAFLALLTLLSQAELFRMPHAHIPLPNRFISHLSGIAILADASFAGSGRIGEITIASLIGFFLIEIVSRKEENRLKRILFSLLATVYPAAFLAYLPRSRCSLSPFSAQITVCSCSSSWLPSGHTTRYRTSRAPAGGNGRSSPQSHRERPVKGSSEGFSARSLSERLRAPFRDTPFRTR